MPRTSIINMLPRQSRTNITTWTMPIFCWLTYGAIVWRWHQGVLVAAWWWDPPPSSPPPCPSPPSPPPSTSPPTDRSWSIFEWGRQGSRWSLRKPSSLLSPSCLVVRSQLTFLYRVQKLKTKNFHFFGRVEYFCNNKQRCILAFWLLKTFKSGLHNHTNHLCWSFLKFMQFILCLRYATSLPCYFRYFWYS